MAQVGNRVFVFGGRSGKERLADLWCFNMDTMQWTQMITPDHLPTPEGRSWHSLTANANDELILYGGLSNNCEPLKDCWTYCETGNKWSPVRLTAEPRLWHTAVFSPLDSEILIYGGGTQNILNYRLTNVYTNDLITLRFSPKSLLRLALDACTTYAPALKAGYHEIPTILQRLLTERYESQLNHVEMAGS